MTKTEYENTIKELIDMATQDCCNITTLLQEYNTVLLKYRMMYETPEEHSYIIDMFNRIVGLENLPLAA